jgi:hypothetical protein
MHVFTSDPDNSRRLVAQRWEARGHTIRGFWHYDDESGGRITVVQQFGPLEYGDHQDVVDRSQSTGELIVLDAYLWPGAQLLAHIVRPWRREGYGKAWAELRRQVQASTGIDMGPAPTRVAKNEGGS